MKYVAVIIKSKQYLISEGDEILVQGEGFDPKATDVIFASNDGKVIIGTPKLDNVSVKFSVVDEKFKGDKVTVIKYKAKSRYRKKLGIRPVFTKLKVDNISLK
ncbi:MAG: 50S ribosomal protein L21 [Microgenomates group bacterium GW2011_GWC1_37_12b]|uniref:50S ribosomal protein L21 n=1 Tax=Candidatus Woesebacteria bacterium GW2011_GWB1_38_8b TaxID=1618571 RepID=A0A0G0PDN2_9BACT|nr:MAG: 50S ribosomal protein L21 [Microgenomates group bacterium GW2011_GWC1_37_12b]KKQ87396.1 MAG: 50S ribosomal protein L21 [Candidatus Woesebacteria bacterium GW2011_GWB1_38_8b]